MKRASQLYVFMTGLAASIGILILADGNAITIQSHGAEPSSEFSSQSPPFKSPEPSEVEFWRGKTADVHIRWTSKDLYITAETASLKVFSTYAARWFDQVTKGQQDGENTISFRLISIVDSMLSIEVRTKITGLYSANSSDQVSWIVLDLRRKGTIAQSYEELDDSRNANLTDYFSEASLLEALCGNRDVANALRKDNRKCPENLNELFGPSGLPLNEPKTHRLTAYALRKFAFSDVRGHLCSVYVELLDAYNFHQSEVRYLKILIAAPPDLQDDLKSAHTKDAGFLYSNRETDNSRFTVLIKKSE